MASFVSAWNLSCGMLAVGLFLMTLILSGFERLERLGGWVCALRIKIRSVAIRVATFAMVFSFVLAVSETMHLMNYTKSFSAQLANDLTTRASRWRHERNWWLSVFNFVIWAVTWRASTVVKKLRSDKRR
eukprot:GHVO01019858.1.p1 GENE.GHVO01019858.1~~GHVO01019858.1.p1  ORF type:complete len:130 (-),score=11.63 GHVO01019858.1:251-640(-)